MSKMDKLLFLAEEYVFKFKTLRSNQLEKLIWSKNHISVNKLRNQIRKIKLNNNYEYIDDKKIFRDFSVNKYNSEFNIAKFEQSYFKLVDVYIELFMNFKIIDTKINNYNKISFLMEEGNKNIAKYNIIYCNPSEQSTLEKSLSILEEEDKNIIVLNEEVLENYREFRCENEKINIVVATASSKGVMIKKSVEDLIRSYGG
ncbi:hypothetical protein [Clostridium baratii]|uniref:hypothetical protein n=1 Tax=Clostridium baratii TaxID=1561 RepID=UPI0005F2815E|nr:hypothetical protein [Clostridium baratii]AQM58606.1 hypothetical protein NPD11_3093 [Clostridium baratii]KJU72401.1 hypothetical protein UC77_04525 [Clostridium baratii]